MRKLLIACLSILLICAAIQAHALSAAVQAACSAGGAAACSADSCTSGLLFSWYGENADVTKDASGGTTTCPLGCSAGDATGTASFSAAIADSPSTPPTGSGTKSISLPNTKAKYTFDWSSSDIMSPTAGTIDLWFYPDTLANQSIFYLMVDSNNRIYCTTDSANGYIGCSHIAGGTQRTARTNLSVITNDTWYHLKYRWDTTVHGSLYQKVTVDTTTGEGDSADNGTDALGTWAGTSGYLYIGDYAESSGAMYIDNIKIYNSWQ